MKTLLNKQSWVIGCLAKCCTCGKEWEFYITAKNKARDHAKKTGHKVSIEETKVIIYNW